MVYLHKKKDVGIIQQRPYELKLKKFLMMNELVDEFLKEKVL